MARCRNFVREKVHVFPEVFQCGNVIRMLRMKSPCFNSSWNDFMFPLLSYVRHMSLGEG